MDTDESSSGSDSEEISVTKKLPSFEQAAAWKLNRLKASLQKPTSELKDVQQSDPDLLKQSKDIPRKSTLEDEQSKEQRKDTNKLTSFASKMSATPSSSSQPTSATVAPTPEVHKNIGQSEEQSKEKRDKVRKEDGKRERCDKKPGAAEVVSKNADSTAESHLNRDTSEKYSKRTEPSGSKPLQKVMRKKLSKVLDSDDDSDSELAESSAKKLQSSEQALASKNDKIYMKQQRRSYVIPKLKKPADSTPGSAPVLANTWSDMLKRGAELERNRPKQTLSSSGSMRRIPKIVPKAGLCGKADVGVLDKIEQHPGFLRWQLAPSLKSTSKTEDEKTNMLTTKANTSPTQQSYTSLLSITDNKPVPSLMRSITETVLLSTATETSVSVLPPASVKSLLATPGRPSLLSTPPSSQKKVLLPTPSTAAAPIPVLVRRGNSPKSRSSRFSSSPRNDDGNFVPGDTSNHPGKRCV